MDAYSIEVLDYDCIALGGVNPNQIKIIKYEFFEEFV